MGMRADFRAILTAASGVTTLLGTRIYPTIAPSSPGYPCAVYNVTDNDPSNHKSGPSTLDFITMDVDVVSTFLLDCESAAAAIRTALESHSSATGIVRVVFRNEDEFYDDANKLHRITHEYLITYKRS